MGYKGGTFARGFVPSEVLVLRATEAPQQDALSHGIQNLALKPLFGRFKARREGQAGLIIMIPESLFCFDFFVLMTRPIGAAKD